MESALFTQHVFPFVNFICHTTYKVIPFDIRPFQASTHFKIEIPPAVATG